MKKFGLVIEGGGTKAAYSGGVLHCLLDHGIYADYGSGISAGAEFLEAYVSRQQARLKSLGIDATCSKDAVGLRPLLKEGTVFGIEGISNFIEKVHPLDYETLYTSSTKMEVGLYNFETHEIEYYDQSHVDKDNKLIKASCALLLLCKPYDFEGKKMMDAGLIDMIPIERSVEVGNEKHIVISCKEEGYVRKPAPKWQLWLSNRVYHDPIITKQLENRHVRYNEQWQLVEDLKNKGDALILRPSKDLGVSRYTTDKKILEPWYQLGYDETLERMDEIKKFIGYDD